MNVVKLLQDKGFKGFKGFYIRSDETLNANPYPLRKCPIFPIFGYFPNEK
jgi:hypothetical protein